MNKLFILKSSIHWKVISENKGGRMRISDIQKYLKTKFPWLQTIFSVLKHQTNIHIKFLCISVFCCWKNNKITLQVYESHLHMGQNWLCQCFTTPHFLSNCNFDYHLDLALFINNGGKTWKTKQFQHNSHVFNSIGISCVCRLGMCITFCKMSALTHNILGWLRNKTKN